MNKVIKIATFNVNSIRARLPLMEIWLQHRENDLDILCMQELKAEYAQFPFDFFENFGFQCRINPQKRYNGTGICSKITPDDILIRFEDPYLDAESRMIYARFGDFHLINIYGPHGDFPPSEKFDFKMFWYDHLLQWIDDRFDAGKDKVLLTGDFNITFDDKDVYDPGLLKNSIGTMPAEREKLHALIKWGFVDAFRLKHPDEVQYTWWDYQGAKIWKNQGMRIDHILITPPLIPLLEDVFVDMWARRKNKTKPSDHAPVIAVFRNLF